MKLFFLRVHPCPHCFGNVRWYARNCPHCQAEISNADRYEWMSQSAKAMFFTGLTVLVFVAGWGLLRLVAAIGLL